MDLTNGMITLRPPTAADQYLVTDAVHASLNELAPWMPWATPNYTVEDGRMWAAGELGELCPFIILDAEGTFVGTCGINSHDPANNRASLGYWLRTDQTGNGYATQAAKLVADFGLSQRLGRIEVQVAVGNEASRRVAEAAGAHYEGIARKRLVTHGRVFDAHILSFT